MSNTDIKRIEDGLAAVGNLAESIAKVAGLMKLIIGMVATVAFSLAAGAFWIRSTSQSIAQTHSELTQLRHERTVSLEQWGEWRRQKDDIDVRLTTIVEGQQKLLERGR